VSTQVDEKTEQIVYENETSNSPIVFEMPDLSKLAHIVNVVMNHDTAMFLILMKRWSVKSAQDLVDGARHFGLEIQAICGYTWVPTERAGQHDACQSCMNIAQQWIGEDGS